MDDSTKGQAPATDDQELAKVLAGMNQQVKAIDPNAPAADPAPATDSAAPNSDGLAFEETTMPKPLTDAAADSKTSTDEPASDPVTEPVVPAEEPATPAVAPSDSAITPDPAPLVTSTGNTELDGLKKDALAELRPLVDHLELPASEKFDTLLLIIRSTDDKSLLAGAHEAAKGIEDDTKRAQALLDIIKEIDYFSAQPAA